MAGQDQPRLAFVIEWRLKREHRKLPRQVSPLKPETRSNEGELTADKQRRAGQGGAPGRGDYRRGKTLANVDRYLPE